MIPKLSQYPYNHYYALLCAGQCECADGQHCQHCLSVLMSRSAPAVRADGEGNVRGRGLGNTPIKVTSIRKCLSILPAETDTCSSS